MPGLDRRSFLFGTGAFVLGGNALGAEVAARPGLRLDLNRPEDALTAMLRMQGRTDGKDAPWWYFGRVYGMVPGQPPVPLVRFEGLEISRYLPPEDGEIPVTGVTTSFFLDWRSKAPLETFANPISGRTNRVEPNLIGGRPGFIPAWYSVRGVRPGRVAPADWPADGLHLSWDYYYDAVWLSHDRSFPPGLPQPAGEASVARARVADLHDLERPFVPATFSSTYFAPYPSWMEMQGQPGYVIWHADGLKLESIGRLPAHFRGWLERAGMADRLYSPPDPGP